MKKIFKQITNKHFVSTFNFIKKDFKVKQFYSTGFETCNNRVKIKNLFQEILSRLAKKDFSFDPSTKILVDSLFVWTLFCITLCIHSKEAYKKTDFIYFELKVFKISNWFGFHEVYDRIKICIEQKRCFGIVEVTLNVNSKSSFKKSWNLLYSWFSKEENDSFSSDLEEIKQVFKKLRKFILRPDVPLLFKNIYKEFLFISGDYMVDDLSCLPKFKQLEVFRFGRWYFFYVKKKYVDNSDLVNSFGLEITQNLKANYSDKHCTNYKIYRWIRPKKIHYSVHFLDISFFVIHNKKNLVFSENISYSNFEKACINSNLIEVRHKNNKDKQIIFNKLQLTRDGAEAFCFDLYSCISLNYCKFLFSDKKKNKRMIDLIGIIYRTQLEDSNLSKAIIKDTHRRLILKIRAKSNNSKLNLFPINLPRKFNDLLKESIDKHNVKVI